jgi:hypothetical protein
MHTVWMDLPVSMHHPIEDSKSATSIIIELGPCIISITLCKIARTPRRGAQTKII